MTLLRKTIPLVPYSKSCLFEAELRLRKTFQLRTQIDWEGSITQSPRSGSTQVDGEVRGHKLSPNTGRLGGSKMLPKSIQETTTLVKEETNYTELSNHKFA